MLFEKESKKAGWAILFGLSSLSFGAYFATDPFIIYNKFSFSI